MQNHPTTKRADPNGDPFENVLARLRGLGCRYRMRGSDSARAVCPTHDDRNPSLVVTRWQGKVVVKCFYGCAKRDVLQRLGLTYADLYYERATAAGKPQIVATYPYTDTVGTIIAEKVRFSPKAFRWRVPDETTRDGWRWNLRGTSVGLYRLPELVDARQVLVSEGERAVDVLLSLGFAGTCPPAGASMWSDTYAETMWSLGCTEVVVFADADQAGRRHAERVAASCHGLAGPQSDDLGPLKVKVLELAGVPSGGDVVDYLAKHSADDLRALIAAAPYWYAGCHAERRRERRREHTRERVRRLRERRACNAPNVKPVTELVCNAPNVSEAADVTHRTSYVTRNAVTHPNVLLSTLQKTVSIRTEERAGRGVLRCVTGGAACGKH